ncbi:hypothetical protein [Bacteroides salyersiae]|uniref:hypothetical protein n=1 Tax=Bacteroides salyersiae TaxID=291644 RepID=UPI001C8BE830|nr:hypothetical protein [Bacteroides salyersiae]
MTEKNKAGRKSPDTTVVEGVFCDGRIVFGAEGIAFGDGRIVFGAKEIAFGDGRIAFSAKEIAFGDGKIIFGTEEIAFTPQGFPASFPSR